MVSQDTKGVRCTAKESFKRLWMVLILHDERSIAKLTKWRRVRSQAAEASNERRKCKSETRFRTMYRMNDEDHGGDRS